MGLPESYLKTVWRFLLRSSPNDDGVGELS